MDPSSKSQKQSICERRLERELQTLRLPYKLVDNVLWVYLYAHGIILKFDMENYPFTLFCKVVNDGGEFIINDNIYYAPSKETPIGFFHGIVKTESLDNWRPQHKLCYVIDEIEELCQNLTKFQVRAEKDKDEQI